MHCYRLAPVWSGQGTLEAEYDVEVKVKGCATVARTTLEGDDPTCQCLAVPKNSHPTTQAELTASRGTTLMAESRSPSPVGQEQRSEMNRTARLGIRNSGLTRW